MNGDNGVLAPFYAMEILARAKALEAEGRSVLHLEVGEAATPPAPAVIAAVRDALPEAQRYTHAKGQAELRRALSVHYRTHHDVEVDPENVLVTMGSSAAFILAFSAAFRPGAKIAVTRPGYPAYFNTVSALGLQPVPIALSAERGWRLSPEDVAAAHAREPFEGLLFGSPANPTGAALGREALAGIASECARLRVRMVSDEIYHRLDYTGPSVSALEVTGDAIVINSFSKYYCMTGWRVGWMVVPPDLVRRTEMLQQNLFISAPTLSQVAARVALGEDAYYEARKAQYAQNRAVLAEGLPDLGFGAVSPSDGAFYIYADASRFTDDSRRFTLEMVEEAGVAATPGIDFDRVDGHRFVRFSFAGAPDTMTKALERMAGFLARRGG